MFFKKLLNYFYVLDILRYIKSYSPIKLFISIISKYSYYKNYKNSQKIYPFKRVFNNDFDKSGIIKIDNILDISQETMRSIHDEFDEFDSTIQFDYALGIYSKGNSHGQYVYLNKNRLVSTGLIDKVMKSSSIKSLETHLGCYVNISHSVAFKVRAGDFVEKGSFIYHRDSYPEKTYKLIIYLSDVLNPGDGEFFYIKGTHNKYNGFPQFGRSRSKNIDKKLSATPYFGKAGDALLFDVNGYHRGGRCVNKDRIVLVISFIPSTKESLSAFKESDFRSINEDEYRIFSPG